MISRIDISNFISFEKIVMDEVGDVNIIIGTNDTGKTGFIKLLYSVIKSAELYNLRAQAGNANSVSYKKVLAEKLYGTFLPSKNGLGELVNKYQKSKLHSEIVLTDLKSKQTDRVIFSFGESTINTINDGKDQIDVEKELNALFIPAKEVLTQLKAIRASREKLQIEEFDDTYIDLISSLVIPTQKGKVSRDFVESNKRLEELFNGEIEQQQDDQFVFRKGKYSFPLQLSAEGVKKIGILTTLIRNRQLNKNSVLFIDEPENSLHPKAINEVVKVLTLIAKQGVQIFLTSHSFALIKQLEIEARSADINDLKFMCSVLTRNAESNIVTCSTSNLFEGIPMNEIIEAGIAQSDEELELEFKD